MLATSDLIAVMAAYASCAVLLSVGALALACVMRSEVRTAATPERWLAFGWVLLAFALLSPAAWRGTDRVPGSGAPVEIWSGPRVDAETPAASVTLGWSSSRSSHAPGRMFPVRQALAPCLALLVSGVLLSLVRLFAGRQRLGGVCERLPVIKQRGRVRICASDDACAPFAARVRGTAFIVVPTGLLADVRMLRLVIAHEAHHHRRRDLHAALGMGLLRALFFWNPCIAIWERLMAELQEIACDRHVLRWPSVSIEQYARTLLWAAENSHGRRYVITGALGIVDGTRGALTRRIMMLDTRHVSSGAGQVRGRLAAAFVAVVMAGASWAVQGAVADHRVSMAQVERLASRIESRGGFPLPVDERVVDRLNDWVADPAGREVMRRAMDRMPAYREMIETTLRAHGLPTELLGMVMAESAFDNDAHPNTPIGARSAGIWQIIPRTGRRLGLEVSPALDERLDPPRATEAAAVFLASLHDRYHDWPVVIAAYNAGEMKIDAIAAGAASATEVRARVLAGDDEHARYVRAVVSAIILIDNPALLE
jgi:hypothetical protein